MLNPIDACCYILSVKVALETAGGVVMRTWMSSCVSCSSKEQLAPIPRRQKNIKTHREKLRKSDG